VPAGLSGLRDFWRTADAAAPGYRAAFIRARLVTGTISGLSLILLPTTLLAALFLHSGAFGTTFAGLLVVSMVNFAVARGFAIWLAFRQGYWIGWKREHVQRSEQPARFYIWTIAHAAMPAIYIGVAAILIVVAIPVFMPAAT